MFLGSDYLINNQTGLRIFESVRNLPIVDAHNHADVAAIARNQNFSNAWELFAATDHYVWEMLRKAGVPEQLITGDATPHDKFIALADVFDEIAGNPVYEWIHLDLRFLGIQERLCHETGEKVWNEVNEALAKDENKPLALLKRMNIEVMCSTDDPVDTLEYHEQVNAQFGRVVIRPTWRPDRILKITKPDFPEYVAKIAKRFHMEIASLPELIKALKLSHDYFQAHGCKASDHGFTLMLSGNGDEDRANSAFVRAMNGETISQEDAENYAAYLFGELIEMNTETNWVTQLHNGAVRDVRDFLFDTIGPDSGGDVCDIFQNHEPNLIRFLNRFDNRLKVVLYCLDPMHQPTLATMSRAFGANVRLGSAWWLCDNPIGMKRQLEYIGSVDLFSAFAGMVSDSRKLLSYASRFEMFRRVLSSVLGTMVEEGQIPEDIAMKLAKKMSYDGPKQFFNV